MNKPENPPAFPQASPEMVIPGQSVAATQGMSLRDWFAGQALAGMLALDGTERSGNWHNNADIADVGIRAYEFADAMLAARQREEPKP